MMQIPKEELLESLRLGYVEYKDCVAAGVDEGDLGHVKGYCVTLEQILSAYGNVSKEEMLKIKRPIIGDVSLRRKKRTKGSEGEIDYDIPTILRNNWTKE